MGCVRVAEMFDDTLSAGAAAHLETCVECTQARRAFDAVSSVSDASASADVSKLGAAAQAEARSKKTVRSFRFNAAALMGVNVLVGTVATVSMSMGDAQHGSIASKWLLGGLFWSLMSVGAVLSIVPGARTLRGVFLAITGAAAAGLLLFSSGLDWNRPFSAGLSCATTECMVAAIPMALAVWLTTRFAADAGRMLTAGLSVGCTGVLALFMHCPNGTPLHLATFHLMPWLMMGGVAVLLRRLLPAYTHAP